MYQNHVLTPLTAALQLVQQGLGSLARLSLQELCSEISLRFNYVSPHRLFPFWRPFLQKSSLDPTTLVGGYFLPGAAWEMVWGSYMFDRKLRAVLMDALSRIEVALRAQIAYHWSAASKDDFPHVDLGTFKSAFLKAPKGEAEPSPRRKLWNAVEQNFFRQRNDQEDIYEEVRRAQGLQDLTIRSFMEFTTMGVLERLLRCGLKHKIVKAVAHGMGVHDVDFFVSCVSFLTRVRNACAHQSRVWNRYWRTTQGDSILRNTPPGFCELVQKDRTGAALTICQLFLRTIAPKSRWKQRLLELFREDYVPEHNACCILGFSSPRWYEHTFWRSLHDEN